MKGGLADYIELGRRVSASRDYNGFCWSMRLTSNPIHRVERYQKGNDPNQCHVTGYQNLADLRGSGYIYCHNEDYGHPLDWYPCTRWVHAKLHARFTNPRAWFDLVHKHYVHGAWFTLLCMNPSMMLAIPGREREGRFREIYPENLPPDMVAWPSVADRMGITRDLFKANDLREPINALWRWQ